MSEAALDQAIARLCRRRGAWHLKTHGSGIGRAGIPDHLICHRGTFVAVEAKAPRGRVTALQNHELGRIRAAGGTAIVARSIGEVEAVLDAVEGVGRPTAAYPATRKTDEPAGDCHFGGA